MTIGVLVVDNHQIMREGLRALLREHEDLEVVGESDNGREAVDLARQVVPDVIIMDISMPCMDGVEATRAIITENPSVKVVALSMYATKQFVVAMLKAGASGYVLKQLAFEELIKAIRLVVEGKTYLCSSLKDMVIDDYKNRLINVGSSSVVDLTEIECNVLKMVADGKSSKEIASQLKKSAKTIDAYRRQIMKKLEVNNLADLVKYAVRAGLATLG